MSGPDWWRVGEWLLGLLLFACFLLLVVAVLSVMVDAACDLKVLDGGC